MDEKQTRYQQLFEGRSVWRSIFAMAIPSLLTIVIMVFYNMADMFFIAQLDDTAKVASVSIISPVFNIIMALGTMVGAGGSSVIANLFGADEREKARDIASLCLYTAVGIGLAVMVLLFLLREPLLALLGTKPDMWEDSKTYLTILSVGTVFMLVSTCMGMLLRAEGAVKEGMFGNLAGTVTNIVLDPLFILVFRWGVAGAAAATVLGNIVSSIFYINYVRNHAAVLSMDPKRAVKAPGEIFPVMALGLPNAASTVLSGFASTFSNGLLSQHGTDAIAASAAAGRAGMLIGMVQMGICMGVQPLMAYHYGSKNAAKLKEILQKVALLTILVGLGTMLICFVFRHFIIGLFLKEAAVAAVGENIILFRLAGAPFLGIVYISTNFLQAVKNAKGAIVVSLLRQGLLLIPLLFILHAVFGFYGIAGAHTTADILSAIVSFVIFRISYRKAKREMA